jgi:lipopolysaccharide/colanic/teichoic acid biosynthesis glycosyltransferase
LRNDPRVTPIGRILRALSLDELPQLFNVVMKDMSLVGPRPITEDEIVRYGCHIRNYYDMRPGITGLWQVSGRSNTTYERRVELDVGYARDWSLMRDIAILFRTIPAVLRRSGAH